METTEKTKIKVEATINAPVEKVWELWNGPQHIVRWNQASDDWHSPRAENDLRVGGRLFSRMEAKDGSFGFDFEAIYDEIEKFKRIVYTLGDGRKVELTFKTVDNKTQVTEVFEAESENSPEVQRQGWQAILNSFKKYAETSETMENMHFDIFIEAKPEKVYKTMLADKTYREWTSIFNPSSHFKGSWEKGSKILFIGTDEQGNEGGMVSRIMENIPNRFVSIEHLGIIENGEEKTSGPDVDAWSGGLENYTLSEQNGNTHLVVEMITKSKLDEKMSSYFAEAWPKALEQLKTLCEK
jgi:uncharacterized protein YndB with AHSA1/START domain